MTNVSEVAMAAGDVRAAVAMLPVAERQRLWEIYFPPLPKLKANGVTEAPSFVPAAKPTLQQKFADMGLLESTPNTRKFNPSGAFKTPEFQTIQSIKMLLPSVMNQDGSLIALPEPEAEPVDAPLSSVRDMPPLPDTKLNTIAPESLRAAVERNKGGII